MHEGHDVAIILLFVLMIAVLIVVAMLVERRRARFYDAWFYDREDRRRALAQQFPERDDRGDAK